MKKLNFKCSCLLLLVALLSSHGASFAGSGNGLAIINGSWSRAKDTSVSLFKIVDGSMRQMANTNLQSDNAFALAVPISGEGFYVLGSGTEAQAMNKYAVYLKPGDVLNIAVNDSTYTLEGENTPENKALEQWHNFMQPLEVKARYLGFRKAGFSTYVDFFPELEAKAKARKSFKYAKTKNPVFEAAFANFRELDFMSSAVAYNFMPRTAHPEAEDLTAYYKSLNLDEITSSAKLLKYPHGSHLISQLVFTAQKAQGKDTQTDYHTLIKNDTLIGEMGLQRMGYIKSYRVFQDFVAAEGKYILTDDQKARLEEVKVKLAQDNKEGEPAIDFRYPDVKGDTIALSDLKGKVVVIDVWATWCGPCKQQIPYLKKMEEEYRGKDVEFLSVSVDVEKDRQKWTDFVKAEGLKGIQLFANGWGADICKYYNIKGIPRFMVVGKNGSMVSTDAPRPSSEDLKKMVDVELSK